MSQSEVVMYSDPVLSDLKYQLIGWVGDFFTAVIHFPDSALDGQILYIDPTLLDIYYVRD